MTSLDMLATWPGWRNKTPDDFLKSPAWAMIVRYNDVEMRMRLTNDPPRDVIALKIKLDDEEHFLGLGNREIFPDLNVLWNEKKRLPDPLVLALIEKECGALLQLIENATRCQLSVVGLGDPDDRSEAQGFEVTNGDGDILATFSLSLSPRVKESFGDVANIDVNHPEIQSLERPAKVQYALFRLNDEEVKALKSGDYLILPENEESGTAKFLPYGVPGDEFYYVVAEDDVMLTFENMAQSEMPPLPPPSRLCLVHKKKTLAVGSVAKLGECTAFAIEEVL